MKERRQRVNNRSHRVKALAFFAWLVFIAALIAFHYARPELEYGIMRYFGIAAREYWLQAPTGWLFILLALAGALSITVLVMNKQLRRVGDAKSHSMWLLIVLLCFFAGLIFV